ncbi:MAG: TerB family tellurite resistance protein [Actinobacteria bacterium]|nr:TerB family tellurite resistance protein [Actinomycetota bacterium]
MPKRFADAYDHLRSYLGLVDDATPEPGPGDDDEHRAVLEVLVATMLVDGTVREGEFDEIERIGRERGWNSQTFSFTQGLGAAVAAARDARDADPSMAALLRSARQRITTPEVRTQIVEACRTVATSDGETAPTEATWLHEVAKAFNG